MAAVAPVTTVTVPPPPAGGNAGPTQQSAPGPVSASSVPASEPAISTSDAAKVILTQPAPAPAPSQSQVAAAISPAPSALAVQAALNTVLLTLDNLPAEHPNSPAVVLLQNKESALRDALTQVLLDPGPALAYLSGVVLNAAV